MEAAPDKGDFDMADVTALVDQIAKEANERMSTLGPKPMAAFKATTAAGTGHDFFCAHWDDIKKAIEFLGSLGGAWGKLVAAVLIKIGDTYHQAHCP
jgi:hypothetical protein